MCSYVQYAFSMCLTVFVKQELSRHVFVSQLLYSATDNEWSSEHTQRLPNCQHWFWEHM
jgi:hypothetical protein